MKQHNVIKKKAKLSKFVLVALRELTISKTYSFKWICTKFLCLVRVKFVHRYTVADSCKSHGKKKSSCRCQSKWSHFSKKKHNQRINWKYQQLFFFHYCSKFSNKINNSKTLKCSKWTINASSSACRKVHFTVHLHSINKKHMKSCQFVLYFWRKNP